MTLNVSPLFRDHAVLQRDITIPLWGFTEPENQIRCTLGNVVGITVSNSCGRFFLRMPPQRAGGPYELTFENLQNGDKACYRDIWIGEVYLASGQSNMAYPLKDIENFESIKAAGRLTNPDVRYFKIPVRALPTPRNNFEGGWSLATADISGDFSAIAYLFGEKIAHDNHVKVGIVEASCGGTGAECWLSREALLTHPNWRDKVTEYDRISFRTVYYDMLPAGQILPKPDELVKNMLAEQVTKLPMNRGLTLGYADPEFDDNLWRNAEMPDSWTMLGYNHGGIFWSRLAVNLPREAAGKELVLSLGALDKGDITYFNGVEVGRTGDGLDMNFWNQPRVYKVPGELVKGGRNVIAVRVASLFPVAMAGGMIGPAKEMFIEVDDQKIPLDVEWKYMMEYNAGHATVEALAMSGPGEPHSQHMLFDNMIAPLIPFAIRGVLWYQGEANAVLQAAEYKTLLQSLIHDWRYRWGQVKLDFIVIQLPGYQTRRLVSPHSQWALLREAQMQCGEPLVVTCDTGDENNIHPCGKAVIAERAAAIADSLINNHRPVYSPKMISVTKSKGRILVKFSTHGSKLQFKGEPDGFAIGEHGSIFRAKARVIDDDTVELSHPKVKTPQIVYYGWSNFPTGNLYNSHGLPAAPFRQRVRG